MKKIEFLTFGFNTLNVVLAAGMLLVSFVSCDKGNENGNGDGDGVDGGGNTTANGVSFDMIEVEGGATDEQGDDAYGSEKPPRQVTLSTFNISKTEVTQALWKAVMGNWPDAEYYHPITSQGLGDNYPMYYVSWEDIVGTDSSAEGYTVNGVTYYQNGFCYKLSQLVGGGKQFRLPTEAEWEYAARGGNKVTNYTKYSGSDNIDEVAWYSENSYDEDNDISGTREVGKKQSNALGLYDMSGNVLEWCSDWLGEYSSDAQTNPTGPADGSGNRVLRGGMWRGRAGYCRVSDRSDGDVPDDRDLDSGFRLAL